MNYLIKAITALMLVLSLVSCNESKNDSSSGTGTIRILATDAPFGFESVSSAEITINHIQVRQSSGNKITVSDKEMTLDLLQLRNGLVETLADIEIPGGVYDEILLIVSGAKVTMKDGREFPLKVPSGSSSGLKVFVSPDIMVTTGLSSDVLLDFDLSRSFVPQGTASDIRGFIFKPVIRAVNLSTAGTISGEVTNVTDESVIPNATVTVSQNGEVIASALTDDQGYFKILGLPSGAYNVKVEKTGFGSMIIEAVAVSAGNEVTADMILTPAQTVQ